LNGYWEAKGRQQMSNIEENIEKIKSVFDIVFGWILD